MDLVTSLCVDQPHDPASFYPQLRDMGAQARRRIYWQCAATFFATAARCQPEARLLLYTNDLAPAVFGTTDFRVFLTRLGVEIRYLPFAVFCPPATFSTEFRNAFYKLDVLQAMSEDEAGAHAVLLDSDCVFARPEPELARAVLRGQLLVLGPPPEVAEDVRVQGLSLRDLGDLYRELDPSYPVSAPRHFGGEILGGSRALLAEVVAALRAAWHDVLTRYPTQPPRFVNGLNLFDGDEYLTSYVINRLPWTDVSPFIRRIWTSHLFTNVQPSDLHIAIWHMPNEKTQGLPLLCRQVLRPHSEFWRRPPAELPRYLGNYLGVPVPIWSAQRLLTLATKLPRLLTLLRRRLRATLQPAT